MRSTRTRPQNPLVFPSSDANGHSPDRDSDPRLPFVGRQQEGETIRHFIAGSLGVDRLSALWIQGPAGIGKSRLIDAVLEEQGHDTITICTRFYPDSTLSISAVLFSSILKAYEEKGLSPPLGLQTTLPDTLAALRGLVRRYPTVLVLEDLHLIDQESGNEFSSFLHGLERESIALICTARPGNGPAYGILLPFLITTLSLEPLTLLEIRELALKMGYDPDRYPNLTTLVLERTHGMPLGVWTVFCSVLDNREAFRTHPVRTVRRLADDISTSLLTGMTRHLGKRECRAAESLAILGQVFSERAAHLLLDDAEELIDRLRKAGIIALTLETPVPIVGQTDESPDAHDRLYQFSHSILHEQLVLRAAVPTERLHALLESDIPLYSTLPFTHGVTGTMVITDEDDFHRFYGRLLAVVRQLIDSPYWTTALRIHNAAKDLLENHRSLLDVRDYRDHLIALLLAQCHLYNAFATQQQFRTPIDRLLELTADPSSRYEATQRVKALRFAIYRSDKLPAFRTDDVLSEARSLTLTYPDLLIDEDYLILITSLAGGVRASGSEQSVAQLRAHLDEILAAAESARSTQAYETAIHSIAPNLLPAFTSEEELADRLALAERILSASDNRVPQGSMKTAWPRFLEITGYGNRALEALDLASMATLSGYNLAQQVALRLLHLSISAALGRPLETIEKEGHRLLREFERLQPFTDDEKSPNYAHIAVATHFLVIGMLRGDAAWGSRAASLACTDNRLLDGFMGLEYGVLLRDQSLIEQIAHNGSESQHFPAFLSYLRERNARNESLAVQELCALLRAPIIRRPDLLLLQVCVGIAEMFTEAWSEPHRRQVRSEVKQGLRHGLAWLSSHDLPGYLPPLAELARRHLPAREIKGLVHPTLHDIPITPAVATPTSSETAAATSGMIEIAVIDRIATTLPGQKEKKIRGARIARLLGMLTAHHLLDAPLTLRQFRDLTTELEDPEESANYLRILVGRLRKAIGADTIITDGENPPHLNMERVEVDLITVASMIREARLHAANNNGAGATDRLMKVFAAVTGRHLYAGLKGEFFDAARQEVYDMIREALLATVELLRREGGEARAEELLRSGREALR